MGKGYNLQLFLTFFVLLLVLSCTKQTNLTAISDPSPPDVVVYINAVPLAEPEEGEEVEITMPISQIIQLKALAVDEDSGVRQVSVGTALTYTCLDSGDEKVYSGGEDWSTHNNVPRLHNNRRVGISRDAIFNFRLIYLRNQCNREDLFESAQGQIYVSARNYHGETNSRVYNVVFRPSDPYRY